MIWWVFKMFIFICFFSAHFLLIKSNGETITILNTFREKPQYIPHFFIIFKRIFVNRPLPFMHWSSLEIRLTFPLEDAVVLLYLKGVNSLIFLPWINPQFQFFNFQMKTKTRIILTVLFRQKFDWYRCESSLKLFNKGQLYRQLFK